MRTLQDLQQMQALPLSLKVALTKSRIRQWVNAYGVEGVSVSFSGGKDSTVLLHLVRQNYPDIPAVFVDTGLEYPEIRDFVKTFDNVEILKPKMNFKKVIEKYGYPFISKEVSERVYYAQRFIDAFLETQGNEQSNIKLPSAYSFLNFAGIERKSKEYNEILKGAITDELMQELLQKTEKGTYKIRQLYKINQKPGDYGHFYTFKKWSFLATAPYNFSSLCCDVMKKAPAHKYTRETGRHQMTGQMAEESELRKTKWRQHGCNGFDMKEPVSNPMAFWTEQDVLQYIRENNIKICSVYGDVVPDEENSDLPAGQLQIDLDGNITEAPCKYKTTGAKRTGCMFCGFGCHLERPGEGRFARMKKTHPKQYEWIMKSWEEGGLGYKEVIDWLNENGGLHIEY